MCCFARPVSNVTQTRIFARLSGKGTQFIAYQMDYKSAEPNAMILPLPVAPQASEESLRFIDMSSFDTFFSKLNRGFPSVSPPPATA